MWCVSPFFCPLFSTINENMEAISMCDNENIKNAEKELEYLTGDEEIRRLAYLREKAIRDEAAAMKKAKREGKEEGREGKNKENAKKC